MTAHICNELKDLINEAVSLSQNGDCHLQHFNGMGHKQWGAATCYDTDGDIGYIDESKDDWEWGRTPEIAIKKLVKKLKKK